MSVLKQILGVQKQTTNDSVLGLTPICFDAKKFAVKNWEKGDANFLLWNPYTSACPGHLSLNPTLRKLVIQIFTRMITLPNLLLSSNECMSERLCDIFHQETFEK